MVFNPIAGAGLKGNILVALGTPDFISAQENYKLLSSLVFVSLLVEPLECTDGALVFRGKGEVVTGGVDGVALPNTFKFARKLVKRQLRGSPVENH